MLARMSVPRPIVFLSDFGLGNEWVGLCHSVMSGIAPQCPIVDLSHLVRPLEVASGAILLADAMPYIPDCRTSGLKSACAASRRMKSLTLSPTSFFF